MSKYDNIIKEGQVWFTELTLKVGNEYMSVIANNPAVLLKAAEYQHRYEWIAYLSVLRLSHIILDDRLENGGITVFWSPEFNDQETFINCYEDTKRRLRSRKTSNISIGIFDVEGEGYCQYNLFTGKKCHEQAFSAARDIFKTKALQ